MLVRLAQIECFPTDYKVLKLKNKVSSSSSMSKLSPFIDERNLIRVGGRLTNADIPYDSQHPFLIPYNHPLTNLIIKYEHERSLHAGVNATLSFVRQKYWPVHGRCNVKSIIHKCISCYKCKPIAMKQQMGQLPPVRVNVARVFSNCGVDFAGPFELKDSKNRNKKIFKGYICLFICLWSKACHLEAVTELSTDAFLATLKRFVSRRGLPSNIYSDNGTNFVGANATLKKSFECMINSSRMREFFLQNQIKWSFIPPRSPHFGGIWEAAIKSAKTLLKRTLLGQSLHFEEFSTILCQVEASLNSRPLVPLSDDPNDCFALTPSHFIIGSILTAMPEENVIDQPLNHVKRFKLMQSLYQRFWKQWNSDYLHQLQERNKWKFKVNHPSLLGSVVLIKEENLPPLQWLLGRIQELHSSADGLIRVVSIKTKNGVFKRAIHKICLLPIS